ncbi:MAG: hypothetical protein NC231_08290 [Bacillus sp. (in: Bacteria)]|nr:hypothetical protein [Bacillus sp. (in: firmicutes)]MCM1426710.1 hypothetical protein [Eubacterium sp.]
MSKLLQNYEQIAASLGLKLDAAKKVIYGQKNGFELLIYAENSQYPYNFTVVTAAKSQMGTLTKEDCKQFAKEEKAVSVLVQVGNEINMKVIGRGKVNKICDGMNSAVNALTSFLKSKGFVPCCVLCGQPTQEGMGTTAFDAGGHYMHLCPDCAGRVRNNNELAKQQKQQKGENLVGGIVGALLGSVIGILCIVVLGQMNLVAAISGVIMAVCTIKGYEILGGKLTKKGVVISSVMMIVMTYVGNCIDWGVLIARELGVDIFTGVELIPTLLAEEIIDKASYWYNLVLLYGFTLLGAVPTIRSALKERKQEDTFSQIGSNNMY